MEGGIHPAVLSAKEHLARGREKVRKQHEAGSPGVQVCHLMTEVVEDIVQRLWEVAWNEIDEETSARLMGRVALVGHSGFGRREMAPFSDLDVMLLHDFHTDKPVLPLVRRFSQNLYDTGIDTGFSSRPLGQIGTLVAGDAAIFTSLCESRLLNGDAGLFHRFEQRLRLTARRNLDRLFALVEEARRDERRKYGETVYLLQPNLKRSKGGLREIQFLRWIGYLCYGAREPDELFEDGRLSREDLQRLRDGREYLLRMRNELHFRTGRAQDLLDRTEQVRLAEACGIVPPQGLLPVEQFMREYFEHTIEIRDVVAHFLDGARPKSFWQQFIEPLVSHQMEGDFRVGPTTVGANRRGLAKLKGDVGEILRLLDLANLHDKRIEHGTWEAIRRAMSEHPPLDPRDGLPEVTSERFLQLMSQPARLGELLRRLHGLRVLEQLIPAVAHSRGLLQFNDYHKYTVDEHSIRTVEAVTALAHDDGPAGDVYRQLRRKRTVHLAALLHDLGKGFPEDHSEVGRDLAEATARRLRLPDAERETLVFLVHKHLLMSHIAQRHDIHDDRIAVQFARDVGSLANLQMLYVLTCADLTAVGPGVLNDWKLQLLTDLYNATLHLLTSDSPEAGAVERVRIRRRELMEAAASQEDPDWWRLQFAVLPVGRLFNGAAQEIVQKLERLRTLPRRDAVAWGRYLADRNAVEYTVGTYEEITPGIFHKLTGALTSQRQQILSAEIYTLSGGLVLDRFYVQDSNFSGPPPLDRIEQLSEVLVSALRDSAEKPPVFPRLWSQDTRDADALLKTQPTQVTIDNTTNDESTILSIFAYDRMGLLYTITRSLFELGLSVRVAKIGTHLDQIVDVFYVVERDGRKVEGDERLDEVRERLVAAIEAWEPVA